MIDGSVKFSQEMTLTTLSLKQAMNNRQITYNCIDAQYMLEDVYSYL